MIRPAAKKVKTYTVEEYFELEKNSDIRHEFVNGKIIPMPGESVFANIIADNCGYSLRTSLKLKGYVIIRHDVRTVVQKNKKYRYPDVSVTKLAEIEETHAVNKLEILIEVTSERSSKIDHEDKVTEYMSLPSLQYYLIISQFEPLVQMYSRDDKGWRFEVFSTENDEIYLEKLGCTLKIKDIYENVTFADNRSDI